MASGFEFSVRALPYIIIGPRFTTGQVLEERYLSTTS